MKAVVLLSGGLDSATTLALAKNHNFACYALSFAYEQRSVSELVAAKKIAQNLRVIEHKTLNIDLSVIGGSALTDHKIKVPKSGNTNGIPITYVPARNTIFLSFALAYAEILKASDIFIGVNAVDYSGYPDCRPEYIEVFNKLANLATKAGVDNAGIKIHTPLINMTKSEIISKGLELGLDYSQTVSCYDAGDSGAACGMCDSCRIRARAFKNLGIIDPTIYRT